MFYEQKQTIQHQSQARTNLQQILSELQTEFTHLQTRQSEPYHHSQNDLLSQMRTISQKLTPTKHVHHTRIDETVLIEQQQTQQFYKQLTTMNQKSTPRRIVRDKRQNQPKPLKQQQQPKVDDKFQRDSIKVIGQATVQTFQQDYSSRKRSLYLRSFREFALSQGAQLASQVKELVKEYKTLENKESDKTGHVKVKEFRKQMVVCKLRDKLVQKVIFKELKRRWTYKKALLQQLEQLETTENRLREKMVLVAWFKFRSESVKSREFLQAIQKHLQYLRLRGLFERLRENVASNQKQRSSLQQCLLRHFYKRWVAYKLNYFFVKHREDRQRSLLDLVFRIAQKKLNQRFMRRLSTYISCRRVFQQAHQNQVSHVFKIWLQSYQIRKLQECIELIPKRRKVEMIFRRWKQHFTRPRSQTIKRYFFKLWKRSGTKTISQLKAINYRKSSLIVKSFQRWQRQFRQDKSVKMIGRILPRKYIILGFQKWRKATVKECRQLGLFGRIKSEKTLFRCFNQWKTQHQTTKFINLFRCHMLFRAWKVQHRHNRRLVSRFRYHHLIRSAFNHFVLNHRIHDVKKRFSRIFKQVNYQKVYKRLPSVFNAMRQYAQNRGQKNRMLRTLEQTMKKKTKFQVLRGLLEYKNKRQRKRALYDQADLLQEQRRDDILFLFFDCWKKAMLHLHSERILDKKAHQIYQIKIKRAIFQQWRRMPRRVHFKEEEYEKNWTRYRTYKWHDV